MAENAEPKIVNVEPNAQPQGGADPMAPSKEDIDAQKKVYFTDHEMRKADILMRALAVGSYKDEEASFRLFSDDERTKLENKLFMILDNIDDV
tara:strand:+ start:132 stop:410 length:279 start_codon:yes stop_codon:yes gene_type:complete